MIDERHEELASLYAFDLLEGAERTQFEAELARNPQLQAVVQELRATAASLAHTAPPRQPPGALKQRVLASIAATSTDTVPAAPDNIIRPVEFRRRSTFLPWAIAACLALSAVWLGQRYVTVRNEVATLESQKSLVEISAQMTQQQLEAERILTRRRMEDNGKEIASVSAQLAQATTQLNEARSQTADNARLLAEARNQLADRERLLADARTRLNERDQQLATLTQRVDALAGASADIGRQLGEAKQQVAKLSDELKQQGNLADLKITALASLLKNSPQEQAIAVWDPRKQEGILNVKDLPALAANEDYQLWVVDPQYPIPVDGGVFRVETASTGTVSYKFKANLPVAAINAFAVTRERKGGVPKAEGPFVLLGK